MEKGKFYTFSTKSYPDGTFVRKVGSCHMYIDNNHFDRSSYEGWTGEDEPLNVRESTPQEIQWLEECEKQGKFIPKEEINFQIQYSIY